MAVGERRSTSGNAVTTTLTTNITSGETVIPIAVSTGYPDGTNGPFFVKIDSETIKCVSRTGLNLNVQTVPVTGRGWDNTSAASHTTSAVVNFVFTATDADEANKHYADATVDNHTQYLNNSRHDLTARHPASVLPLGSPGNSAPGDTANAGTASSVARSDHRHGREADTNTRAGTTLQASSFSVPNATTTNISWTTETADTDGYISVPSSTITIPTGKGGIYAITVKGTWTNVFTDNKTLFITAAGVLYPVPLPVALSFTGGSTAQNWTGSITLPLSATDTVSVAIGHENAAPQSTTATLYLYRVSA